MSKHLHWAAFGVGAVAIGWVAAAALRANPLALAITLLIAAFYGVGAWELWRFDRDTRGLDRALDRIAEPPPSLADWLSQVPHALRGAVRLRVEGDRYALPGPALTPYLVGLLVLLGMLGTFLGMVVTLNGTGMALEHATDVQTMRDSLAAPVKGLGLAFGTSVAGVAASAMLGLMSALCRRGRLQTAQRLDTRIASTLRGFTRAHQREASLELQRQQAGQVPLLVGQLQALTAQLAQQATLSNERLLASQERFQGQAETAYRDLAASVDRTLQRSLAEAARAAAQANQAVVAATMSGIAADATALHSRLAAAAQQQLDGLNDRIAGALASQLEGVGAQLDHAVRSVSAAWQDTSAQLGQQSVALLQALDQAHAGLQADLAARDAQRLAAWTGSLTAMAASLQREWQQAGARTLGQQAQICATLEHTAGQIAAQAEAHARSTIAEVARLVHTAAEAPRAAAELVAQLRDKLSDSLARDHTMLEERSRLMAALSTLLDTMQRSADEQRLAIARLVESTSAALAQAGARFTETVDTGSARMASVAAQVTDSAVDVASLGEAFGVAVDQFSQSGDKLMSHLQRVDETLAKAITRSDDQLGYYVAQAREVIDLSLMSQKQIVEDLQRLADRRAAAASEA